MIVDDLNLRGTGPGPNEAETPLIVHTDAVLALPITPERLETVPRRGAEKVQCLRRVQLRQLALGDARERSESLGRLALEQCLRVLALERQDHA